MKIDNLIKKTSDFIGNLDGINQIKNILNNSTKCILIKGPPSCGKTTLIKLILNELNIKYNYLTASKLPSRKHITNFINMYFNTYNIADLINQKNNKNAIIIDNVETLNNNHKYCLLEIIKRFYKSKKFIIFITNKNHYKCSKIVNEISETILISNPSKKDIIYYVKQNFPDLDNEWIEVALKESNGNINTLNNFIKNNKIIINKKIHTTNLFNIVYQLFSNYISFENIIDYYNNDKYLLPLIFHENYLQYLNYLKLNIKKKENDIIDKIMLSLIDYDQLDNYMYAYQYWDLQDICGLISCSIGSYYLNKYNKVQLDDKLIINKMCFTSYLNKVSLISINRKSIEKIYNFFQINDIYKLLRIRYLINNIPEDKLENIMKNYHITKKELITLIKIDKNEQSVKVEKVEKVEKVKKVKKVEKVEKVKKVKKVKKVEKVEKVDNNINNVI